MTREDIRKHIWVLERVVERALHPRPSKAALSVVFVLRQEIIDIVKASKGGAR